MKPYELRFLLQLFLFIALHLSISNAEHVLYSENASSRNNNKCVIAYAIKYEPKLCQFTISAYYAPHYQKSYHGLIQMPKMRLQEQLLHAPEVT